MLHISIFCPYLPLPCQNIDEILQTQPVTRCLGSNSIFTAGLFIQDTVPVLTDALKIISNPRIFKCIRNEYWQPESYDKMSDTYTQLIQYTHQVGGDELIDCQLCLYLFMYLRLPGREELNRTETIPHNFSCEREQRQYFLAWAENQENGPCLES